MQLGEGTLLLKLSTNEMKLLSTEENLALYPWKKKTQTIVKVPAGE